MRWLRLGLGLGFAALLGGCSYYPNLGSWNQAAIEQPQPVDFYYGYVISRRVVPVEYADRLPRPHWTPDGFVAANTQQVLYSGWAQGLGSKPSLPAVEYTVMLDKGTTPPDPALGPGQRPSVIVVQNEQWTREGILPGQRAVIRVVGNRRTGYSGRVMRADSLANIPGESVEQLVSANRMHIPLDYVSPPPPPPPFAPPRLVPMLDP